MQHYIPSDTPFTLYTEAGSRYQFVTREEVSESEYYFDEYGRHEGMFLTRSIIRHIQRQKKQTSLLNDNYYPYQKRMLQRDPSLERLVANGYTIYWRRRGPESRMELLAVKTEYIVKM